MQQQILLHIPRPCHEDWNKMAPVDKGKFCGSCNKQVVDFSLMSDQQILNYFSNATGKTCGRFADDQLQRALQPTRIEKTKTWWFAAMMPLLLLFDKATAQKKNSIIKETPAIIKQEPKQQIMGKVAAPIPKDSVSIQGDVALNEELQDTLIEVYNERIDSIDLVSSMKKNNDFIIKGKITDENGLPLSFASLIIQGKGIGTVTDSAGMFTLKFNNKMNENILLKISYVGYETKEIQVQPDSTNNENIKTIFDLDGNVIAKEIRLAPTACMPAVMGLSEVVITAGGVSICTKVKRTDAITNSIRKAFRNNAFKVYPNPLPKGRALHVEIKNAGEYSIQVLDNASKLLLVNEFVAESDKAVATINIPSPLAAAI